MVQEPLQTDEMHKYMRSHKPANWFEEMLNNTTNDALA